MLGDIFLSIILIQITSASIVKYDSKILNVSAIGDDGVYYMNFALGTTESPRDETFYYIQQQLLSPYVLEMLTQNRSGLNFENSGAVPIHLTLLNDNAAADGTAYFFRDTVVNEQYIGDTGNVFLNRLAQEAVSNGIPLTNVFEVRAGTVHLKQ
ncbi:hypothetical protein GCK72_006793 [Caenorhabditis remanei]|uniref:Uncharacterized protein n=1 Tax=Caenorhabditis remanei TaxID=31234 RepID=A0A6A5HH75_CAERE|nr:hypothetical protein GCK72_006793 [Caenorhabditis remanei]KAF1766835.1 hypothetical protein GCK72_006793 [Caenorhabditis remanei]